MASVDKEDLINDTNLKKAFETFDLDGNGVLTIDEIKAIFS